MASGPLQPTCDETGFPRSECPHWRPDPGGVACAGDVMAIDDSVTVAIGAGH